MFLYVNPDARIEEMRGCEEGKPDHAARYLPVPCIIWVNPFSMN